MFVDKKSKKTSKISNGFKIARKKYPIVLKLKPENKSSTVANLVTTSGLNKTRDLSRTCIRDTHENIQNT